MKKQRCLLMGGYADGEWADTFEDVSNITVAVPSDVYMTFDQQQYVRMSWLVGEERTAIFIHGIQPEEVWPRLLDAYHHTFKRRT